MATQLAASQTLKAVVVLEKDTNGDVLTWAFPAVDKSLETVLSNRSGLLDSLVTPSSSTPSNTLAAALRAQIIETPYRFSRFQNSWLYQLTVPLDSAAAKARKVVAVSISVVSSTYNPTKMKDLTSLMLKAYTDSETPLSPVPITQVYLSILTTNKYSGPFGSFDDGSYDARRALIAPLKFLIGLFGADSITIWIAILLKKRVVVYHPRLNEVQNLVKIFPLLGGWHRQDVGLLRPHVNLASEIEVAELTRAGVYVAGVTDSNAQSRRDLYDLYVDAQSKSFSFGSDGGRPADFTLTKFHRTTAETFVQAAQTENDQGVIKVVATQTKELLDKIAALRSADPTGVITSEGLAAAGLPPAMQTWIFAVASAEGLTKK